MIYSDAFLDYAGDLFVKHNLYSAGINFEYFLHNMTAIMHGRKD